MKVIDPGHEYALSSLDGEQDNRLVFVKREGPGYPGNIGHHPGTTCQEVLRAIAHRLEYVNNQIPCVETGLALEQVRGAIFQMEVRAAARHRRQVTFGVEDAVSGKTCDKCGHVGCEGKCH